MPGNDMKPLKQDPPQGKPAVESEEKESTEDGPPSQGQGFLFLLI